MANDGFSIRNADDRDCETLALLIRELAEYEKLGEHVRATPDLLRRHLFGARPLAEALVAERQGTPVGFALFFQNFSTFRAQPGLYLEDLFVRAEHRGLGIGRALLTHLAQIAVERDCGRFEWAVLDWNAPATGFYRRLGAEPMDDWTVYRLHEKALRDLALGDSGGLA
jgi:GNAT superfamily N-acetyltransferase